MVSARTTGSGDIIVSSADGEKMLGTFRVTPAA
jgi:hypothetical protein